MRRFIAETTVTRVINQLSSTPRKFSSYPTRNSTSPTTFDLKKAISAALKRRRENAELAESSQDQLEEIHSLAASRHFDRNKKEFGNLYPEIEERINPTSSDEGIEVEERRGQIQLPLAKLVSVEDSRQSPVGSQLPKGNRNDRGFYIKSSSQVDEYIRGTTANLPVSQVIHSLTRGRPRPVKAKKQFKPESYGSSDPVEVIEFYLPRQQRTVVDANPTDSQDDWLIRYGKADPTVQPSQVGCSACGAHLHCQDASLPGFLPVDYFEECEKTKFRNVLCRRCYLVKHHNFLLNVNISDVDYQKVMGKLKTIEEALIVLVVDLLDFPGSIYAQLLSIIGKGKPFIVVGNKVDLLPPDGEAGYLSKFRASLIDAVTKMGFAESMNLMHTTLVSAKTGYGVEDLISFIQSNWGVKGDVYLVGCTNVGKSTLFNTLLQSDLCKVRAMDLVERATTSIWPGTTLNLLKFPIMNPTPYKLAMRMGRLRGLQKKLADEDRHQHMLLNETRDNQYAVLQGYVGTTFKTEKNEEERLVKPSSPTSSLFFSSEKLRNAKSNEVWDPNDHDFKDGNWCFDTPGTVNKDQIINELTLEELVKTVPKSIIVPRTFVVGPGGTLFLGGLGRIDLTKSEEAVLFTVFSSRELPVHVVRTSEALQFYESNLGTTTLAVPFGNAERLKLFPAFGSAEFQLKGLGSNQSCGDVILSSAGWVSLALRYGSSVAVRAFTPGGRGLHFRTPSLLPFAVSMRGKRVVGTPAYAIVPLRFPLEEKWEKQKFARWAARKKV